MKAQKNKVFQYIFIFVLVLATVRFFPILMRLIQIIAIGVRAYWWAIVPALIIGLSLWKLKRRMRVSKKSADLFETATIRDVTNSTRPD